MRPRPTRRFETMRVQTHRHQTQSVYWHEAERRSKGKHTEHNGFVAIREPDWRAMSRCESGLAKQWPNPLMKRIFATAYAGCLKG